MILFELMLKMEGNAVPNVAVGFTSHLQYSGNDENAVINTQLNYFHDLSDIKSFNRYCIFSTIRIGS